MHNLRLERFSYRFAEQVLNSKLAIKQEVESILSGKVAWALKKSSPTFLTSRVPSKFRFMCSASIC